MTPPSPAPFPRLPLNADVFTLFAHVFNALNPPAVRAELLNLELDQEEKEIRGLGDDIRTRLGGSRTLSGAQQSTAARELASGQRLRTLRTAWKILAAIDWACRNFGLQQNRVGMGPALAEQLEWDRKLNTDGPGLVLPKACPTPQANHILLRNLHNLTWVSTGQGGYSVDYAILPRNAAGLGKTIEDPCSVGFIKVAMDVDDLTVKCDAPNGVSRYSVYPNPAKRDGLRSRIEEGIKGLAETGADIIILPESVVDDDLLNSVVACLTTLPDGTSPIVIAGTRLVPNGGGPLHSRCTSLADRGRLSWHQDKLHPFNLKQATIADWGLATRITVGLDGLAHENIAPEHAQIAVRDASFGRIMVLICQDLSEGAELIQMVEHLSPNYLVVPVLDSAAGQFWQMAGAAVRSSFVGGTYVSNSHFIYSMRLAAKVVDPPPPPFAFFNIQFPRSRRGDNGTTSGKDFSLF